MPPLPGGPGSTAAPGAGLGGAHSAARVCAAACHSVAAACCSSGGRNSATRISCRCGSVSSESNDTSDAAGVEPGVEGSTAGPSRGVMNTMDQMSPQPDATRSASALAT
eukprot:310525-Chlamydomonas_euryale.AAC.2